MAIDVPAAVSLSLCWASSSSPSEWDGVTMAILKIYYANATSGDSISLQIAGVLRLGVSSLKEADKHRLVDLPLSTSSL